jgi:uncharacterized protein YodC (DUF2158 family)
MAESLRVGDVVRLKSGGPKMVIEKIERIRGALCTWQDAKKESRSYCYLLTSLVKTEDEPQPPIFG